jgi:hypothetical protein
VNISVDLSSAILLAVLYSDQFLDLLASSPWQRLHRCYEWLSWPNQAPVVGCCMRAASKHLRSFWRLVSTTSFSTDDFCADTRMHNMSFSNRVKLHTLIPFHNIWSVFFAERARYAQPLLESAAKAESGFRGEKAEQAPRFSSARVLRLGAGLTGAALLIQLTGSSK